ncbi:hypothetical protein BTJ39_13220 [Izhakiella australiensis]|uniref:Phosphoenolpyruvate-protein phosphotransferase n=1 Tax=Izhakiella australiensis TaxID=1926881 RepID=A0A1S8YL64_9GAMM|nr:phosphoenolpyruvate-utilizing N-terminal domain-containing protein [Izhakiella australiensis]OON39605.1 hypothetical protein BTJ39_13220 [Izhakiella australiensis]
MQTHVKGLAVSPGVASGRITIYRPERAMPADKPAGGDPAQTLAQFEQACEQTLIKLRHLEEKVRIDAGEACAQLFEAHQLMLQDDDFLQTVRTMITQQQIGAVRAVISAGEEFAAQFAAMDDDYFKARAADVRDISWQLAAALGGGARTAETLPDGRWVLLADELLPSEVVQLDRQRIVALVMRQGTENSHAVILARALTLPTVIKLALPELPPAWEGEPVIVDADSGDLWVDPDDEINRGYQSGLR